MGSAVSEKRVLRNDAEYLLREERLREIVHMTFYIVMIIYGIIFLITGIDYLRRPKYYTWTRDYLAEHPRSLPFGRNDEETAVIWNCIYGVWAVLFGLLFIYLGVLQFV